MLSHFCRNPDPEDTIAFDAAVLLGKLCVMDENAKFKLLRSLEQSSDTHIRAKVCFCLIVIITQPGQEWADFNPAEMHIKKAAIQYGLALRTMSEQTV